jgi:competence protein CoiA
MKFAVVGGERREARPGLLAECPVCGDAMTAKCGEHRVHHWAHRGARICDPWLESETEWHRAWKNHFPKGWQEIIRWSESGEKHIADVKTESGVVLEFQHSFLCPEGRESRESFYQNMVWVVDGLRRRQDRVKFFASLGTPIGVSGKPRIFLVPSNKGALLRDWAASRVPVYFDFGDSEPGDMLRFNTPALWRLSPRSANGTAYLSPVPKRFFLRVHREGRSFEREWTETVNRVAAAIERAVADCLKQQAPWSRPLIGFERYMARRQLERRRF